MVAVGGHGRHRLVERRTHGSSAKLGQERRRQTTIRLANDRPERIVQAPRRALPCATAAAHDRAAGELRLDQGESPALWIGGDRPQRIVDRVDPVV
jgi:hypothetical protein